MDQTEFRRRSEKDTNVLFNYSGSLGDAVMSSLRSTDCKTAIRTWHCEVKYGPTLCKHAIARPRYELQQADKAFRSMYERAESECARLDNTSTLTAAFDRWGVMRHQRRTAPKLDCL
jgi:hypothetical protein